MPRENTLLLKVWTCSLWLNSEIILFILSLALCMLVCNPITLLLYFHFSHHPLWAIKPPSHTHVCADISCVALLGLIHTSQTFHRAVTLKKIRHRHPSIPTDCELTVLYPEQLCHLRSQGATGLVSLFCYISYKKNQLDWCVCLCVCSEVKFLPSPS